MSKKQNKRYVNIRHSSTSEDSLSRTRSRENISNKKYDNYREVTPTVRKKKNQSRHSRDGLYPPIRPISPVRRKNKMQRQVWNIRRQFVSF